MAINPKCDACGAELNEAGGILFSPPSNENTVNKYHVCKECYGDMEDLLGKKEEK